MMWTRNKLQLLIHNEPRNNSGSQEGRAFNPNSIVAQWFIKIDRVRTGKLKCVPSCLFLFED